jgi:hypothetical protein
MGVGAIAAASVVTARQPGTPAPPVAAAPTISVETLTGIVQSKLPLLASIPSNCASVQQTTTLYLLTCGFYAFEVDTADLTMAAANAQTATWLSNSRLTACVAEKACN